MPKEEPSEEVQQVLYHLSENANQVFFAFDLDESRFIYLNQYFEELWQMSREEITHDPSKLLSTVHPEDQEVVKNFYLRNLKESGEKQRSIEFRLLLSDKSVRWVYLNSYAYNKQTDRHVVAGLVDNITETKQHQFMLNKFAAKKNAVLEILSHDLSRPLINIQSLSKMLSEQLSDHKQEVDQIIKMITKSSSRAIELIRSFVQQEFLESAQTKLILKRVNMVQEIRQVMEQFQDEEAKLDKHFYFESSSEDISIKIDDNKFMQVLNNLLSNAIKFTPDGGEIKVSLSETQSTILVTVSDNGIGIPKHLQNGLFERFPKARRKGLKGEPSTGLGMSIIKNIVNWHEGEIWLESEENKGSTFYIQLPKR